MGDTPTIRLADIADHYRGRGSSSLPLRCRTLLNVGDGKTIRGHTIRAGETSLSVNVPTPLDCDKECGVFLAFQYAGHVFSIVGRGRVLTCARRDEGGYRLDMHFSVEDKKSLIAMQQLFGTESSARL